MRGNVHKLYRVLVLYVWLLVVPGVSLCVHTTPAESAVYDIVSPGTLQPGSKVHLLLATVVEPEVDAVAASGLGSDNVR